MKPTEIAAVVEGLAPVVKDFVAKQVAPLTKRVDGLEEAAEAPGDVESAARAAADAAFRNFAGAFVKAFDEAQV